MAQDPLFQGARRPIFIDDTTKEIIFNDFTEPSLHVDGAMWLPCLGYNNKNKFDGHIYISGATESGKSTLIRKMIENDRLKRKCILFTDLQSKDPSLGEIEYRKFDEYGKNNWEWLSKNEANKILIFDDVQFNKGIIKYRDAMIEKGRKMNTLVICVNHRLQDYQNTKVPLNDARYVITFPCSNRGNVFRYLKYEFGLDPDFINQLLDIACEEGRYLIIHKFFPNCIATTESIVHF